MKDPVGVFGFRRGFSFSRPTRVSKISQPDGVRGNQPLPSGFVPPKEVH